MSEYEVEQYEHAGMNVTIALDWGADDPRHWHDGLTRVVWTDCRSRLVLKQDECIDLDRYPSVAHAVRWLTMMDGNLIALPFRIEDHGPSARCYFVGPEDENPTGFVTILRIHAAEEGFDAERAEKYARTEFGEFISWVAGEVYGWVVESSDGQERDSCWGYYGDLDYVHAAANEAAEAAAHEISVNEEPTDVAEVLAEMRRA